MSHGQVMVRLPVGLGESVGISVLMYWILSLMVNISIGFGLMGRNNVGFQVPLYEILGVRLRVRIRVRNGVLDMDGTHMII